MDTLRWQPNGGIGLQSMLEGIRGARRTVRLETYIFRAGPPGEAFRTALAEAAARGILVRILIDALGSQELPAGFWGPVQAAGGEVRAFNPFGSGRYLIRNHRKLCVVDEEAATITGFNIGPEYDGDGVTKGWMDVGIEIRGPSARSLAAVFDRQFYQADRRPRLLARYQKRREDPPPAGSPGLDILPVSPGRQSSCLLRALYQDLPVAKRIWICTPYFLPTPRLRRLLRRAVQRGADVRLLLPARTDVPLAWFAGRRLYAGLLRADIRIFEYLPQVLHAKVFVIDDALYVGSSNFDQRSLFLNHEIMVRTTQIGLRTDAQKSLDEILSRSREVTLKDWASSRSWATKLRERWAYFLLCRLDPWLTHGFTRWGES